MRLNRAFDPAGDHRATTFNVEHVFDAHQERLVDLPGRQRNELINRVQQILPPSCAGLARRLAAVALPQMIGVLSPETDTC